MAYVFVHMIEAMEVSSYTDMSAHIINTHKKKNKNKNKK